MPPWKSKALLINNCFGEIPFANGLEKSHRSFTVLDEEAAMQNSVEKANALAARIRCASVLPVEQESRRETSLEARFGRNVFDL